MKKRTVEEQREYMKAYRLKRRERPLDEPDMTKVPTVPKDPKDKVIEGLNARVKELEAEVNRLKKLPKPRLPEIKDGKLTYCRHGLLYCEVCHDNHK